MAISRMSLLDLVHKAGLGGDMDFLREGLKLLAQAIIELESDGEDTVCRVNGNKKSGVAPA